MDSQIAIVTPAQLTHFADSLEESTKFLRNESRKLQDSVSAAQSVWKDAKYTSFHQQLSHCAEAVEKFGRQGLKYSEFLREKAQLANRYLQRGR